MRAPRMDIALVWAMAENRVIGVDGRLPWRLPAEMAHFRRVTMGHPVIMGRRTFASMRKPLPGRTNIVLSRGGFPAPAGVQVVADFEAALASARTQCTRDGVDTVMVVGGADVYALALPRADVLHMTLVHAASVGDTCFPPFDCDLFVVESEQHCPTDAQHAVAYSIYRMRRKVVPAQ